MSTSNRIQHLTVASVAYLCLTTNVWAQFLPPSMPSMPTGVSPRAHQMKGEARDAKDASRATPSAAPSSHSSPTPAQSRPSQDSGVGSTLHRAASEGNLELLQSELTARPGEVKKRDGEGYLALHQAAAAGQLEAVKFLLVSSSDVNAKGLRGETPIYLAAVGGHPTVIEALLQAGADPNLATKELRTPLQRAAMEGHLAAVKALLRGGADASAKDRQGRTALDLAERYRAGDEPNMVIGELLKAK